MMLDYLTYAAIALLVVMFLSQAIRVLREYERGVIFTLGRFTGVKGPGLYPAGSVGTAAGEGRSAGGRAGGAAAGRDLARQRLRSRSTPCFTSASSIPNAPSSRSTNYMAATSQLAQTTLRSVLGEHELDEMLAERDRLNADIQEILDKQTDVLGNQGHRDRDQGYRHQRDDGAGDRQAGRGGGGCGAPR